MLRMAMAVYPIPAATTAPVVPPRRPDRHRNRRRFPTTTGSDGSNYISYQCFSRILGRGSVAQPSRRARGLPRRLLGREPSRSGSRVAGHAFAIPIPRVEHSFIQQARSNGPHWRMGRSRIRKCVGPKLVLQESDKRMKKVITCASMLCFGFCASVFLPAGSAHADLCPYPGVGSGGGALFAQGGFCDYPTEINGSHMHCEAGGFGVNGIVGGATGGGSFAFGGAG